MPSSNTLRPYARSLVSVGEHRGAHRAAVRAGVSVLLPFLIVYGLGHVEWSIYAAFGAFTSVYGRFETRPARLRMQAVAAVVMVGTVMLGSVVATLPGKEWIIVAVAGVWAMVVARVSEVFRFAPPGPLFAVFGLCAIASAPGTFGLLPVAFTVAAASALLALVIGQVGRVRGADARGADARGAAAPSTSPAVPTLRPWRVIRYGVAAILAGALSTGFGIGHPYWAMVAAIVPLVAADLPNAFVRASHRVLGTVVGLAVAWLILLPGPSGLVAIALVVALQVAAELFVLRNYGLALVFITPLALVMIDLVRPTDPTQLITDRAVETLLGTAVAIVIACLPLLPIRPHSRTSDPVI